MKKTELKNRIEVIYSKRRTISMEIRQDLRIIVRAPQRIRKSELYDFIESRMDWLQQHYQKMAERAAAQEEKTKEKRILEHPEEWYRKRAAAVIGERAAYYSARMQVSYGRITIRNQKTRWGSCSSLGNLNFNWNLILLPPELLDYVVVHELAHRKEMNHSPAFWAVVGEVLPDYQERRAQLKKQRIEE